MEELDTNLIKPPLCPSNWYALIGIPNLYNIFKGKNMEHIIRRDIILKISDNDITFIPIELGLTVQEDKNKLVDELLKLKSYYKNYEH